MTSIASRKQARRFFGSMGAAMRCTSRSADTRHHRRIDATARVHDDLLRELMAR